MSYNKSKSLYSLDGNSEDEMKDNSYMEDRNDNINDIDDYAANNKFRRSLKTNTDRGFFYPKAVATWLFDNTALTFEQIAYVCNLHIKTVEAIANEEGPVEVVGCNPIDTGEMSKEDINRCENDHSLMPSILPSLSNKSTSKKKAFQYIPLARRRAKPDAILWLITNCPDLSYAQIMFLIGTTKNTIEAIANRTHWNMDSLRPRDPVLLKLCKQEVLQDELLKAKISIQHEENYRKAEEAERLDKEKRLKKNTEDLNINAEQNDCLDNLNSDTDKHNIDTKEINLSSINNTSNQYSDDNIDILEDDDHFNKIEG
ncbi:MAG: DUF1013 domain-containing protein [Anaplasmataceae bacterium]|nr:DUF1013 domain-containing protein [Anaplasmataceae bacterium]